MSAHTPGPWEVQMNGEEADMVHASADHCCYGTIVDLDGSEFNADVTLANARLIAAAPEMLEALKFYAEHMKLGYEITDYGEVAEKAIAKAEGDAQ